MKNAGKACNNRLYRHIRTFEKIIKNYFVISDTNIVKIANFTFDIVGCCCKCYNKHIDSAS